MKKYSLTIAYDGTHYHGWQIQSHKITIQEVLEGTLEQILRHRVHVVGSGRTDSGTHALGQVAHFASDQAIDGEKVLFSLNALLPSDIRILALDEVDAAFHARFDATGKTYHYHFATLDCPFKRAYSLCLPRRFDQERLHEALDFFVGTHDFTSFANAPSEGSVAKNGVRTLRRLDLTEEEGGFRLEFEGSGFLYKMVRNIVGTLLEVGRGKRSVQEVEEILAACDRRCAGQAAPAHGLFLMNVSY